MVGGGVAGRIQGWALEVAIAKADAVLGVTESLVPISVKPQAAWQKIQFRVWFIGLLLAVPLIALVVLTYEQSVELRKLHKEVDDMRARTQAGITGPARLPGESAKRL